MKQAHIHISTAQPGSKMVHFSIAIDPAHSSPIIKWPRWRPGRYEFADYAQHVRHLRFLDASGKEVSYKKHSPHEWIPSSSISTIEYDYHAAIMDAGNSYYDERQLYINFINCIPCIADAFQDGVSVSFDLPENSKKVSTLLLDDAGTYYATDYYQLVDSTFVASDYLVTHSFSIQNTQFDIHLISEHPPKEEHLNTFEHDIKRFAAPQIALFGSFPTDRYQFFIQLLPYTYYHGVEHQNGTVITIGPESEVFTSRYPDLLGVSSHELFHTWNVCRIRPAEMLPYDFSKEAIYPTGYITEGVTTYYGDLMLVRSGIFDWEAYKRELETLLQRHLENEGRHHISLTESSIDLWLDGYKPNLPSRKVSIYIKGALCALLLDLHLRASGNKSGLDEFMQRLWAQFGHLSSGYTHGDIKSIIGELAPNYATEYIDSFLEGTVPIEKSLFPLFKMVGLNLTTSDNTNPVTSRLGIKGVQKHGALEIKRIASGSPGERFFSLGDQIKKINGHAVSDVKLLKAGDELKISFSRFGLEYEKSILLGEERFFPIYQLQKNLNASEEKKNHFKSWLSLAF